MEDMSNNKISNEEIVDRLNWRYAVKTFDAGKKVSDTDWETLENALVLAPSSYGLQPYKFIVITDQAMKEQMVTAAYGQKQPADCSHLVVVTYKKVLTDEDVEHFVERIVEVRRVERESLAEYEQMMKNSAKKAVNEGYIEAWNSRQAYLALGFLLETAAMIGVDACPMEGFSVEKVNEILNLKDYSAVTLCAVGYRDAENDWLAGLPKVRFSKSELIKNI